MPLLVTFQVILFSFVPVNQFACEHPVKVINPYTEETLFVPCGQCHMCLARKASTWTERLEIERAQHPYCLFGTLTYSDKFLPKFDFSEHGFVQESTGELIPFNELESYLDYDSIQFINHRGCLPVGDVRDCQLFIKRLRERVRNSPDRSEKGYRPADRYIRYFLVEELGETTFRPHYHFIIFTSSKWLSEHAKDVVASCWCSDSRYSDSEQLGIIDVQNVQSSASSYVAQYINSFSNSPKIYRYKRFRPFKIFSKCPPIGSFVTNSKEIQELFYSGSVTLPYFRRASNDFVDIPLPKSLYTRLYPRVVGFDRWSPDVLSGLYCKSVDVKGMSFKDFEEYVRKRAFTVFDGVSQYFRWILDNMTEKKSNLHSVFSCLKRIAFQSDIFGISPNFYFDRILAFYNHQDYSRLYSQMEQSELMSARDGGSSRLLCNDLVFLDRLSDSQLNEISKHDFLVLKSYGWNEKDLSLCDFLESIDFTQDIDFIESQSKSRKIIEDTRKKKAKNEYLEYRTKDRSFINYLIRYHGLSKYNERTPESVA